MRPPQIRDTRGSYRIVSLSEDEGAEELRTGKPRKREFTPYVDWTGHVYKHPSECTVDYTHVGRESGTGGPFQRAYMRIP